MINAYFDDYNLITIEISNEFYNGDVSGFKLKTKNDVIDLKTATVSGNNVKCILCAYLDFNIDIDTNYYIDCEYGYKTNVQYRYIVDTYKFNRDYFTNERLGCFYTNKSTTFKVWAPTARSVIVKIYGKKTVLVEMDKSKGLFTTTVDGDFENCKYTYLVNVNNSTFETVDPYSLSVSNNCEHSIIIDKTKIKMFKKTFKNVSNPSVYELSTKYFTADESTNHKYKETFRGLVEEGTVNSFGDPTGFDYLKSLNITNIQLMPINSFHTIDDYHNDTHNWGYDPQHYIALENTYSYAVKPIDKINEFKVMVKKFNDADIGVNVDVVFSHVYNVNTHAFNKLVPYYYYRKNSNGSYCGNDIATEKPMVRNYILTVVNHLANILQIDGINLDLMGLIDIETIKILKSFVRSDFMIYGNGIDRHTKLEKKYKASDFNANKLPGIGYFNNYFKSSLIGKNILDGHKCLSDISNDKLAQLILGEGFVDDYLQSVNYVESHDDYTLFDKISDQYSNPENVVDFINKILIISKGITFIHSGQEVYRTKHNKSNTYCSGYKANNMKWNDVTKHEKSVLLFQKLLKLRQLYSLGDTHYFIDVDDFITIKVDEVFIIIDKDNYLFKVKINA